MFSARRRRVSFSGVLAGMVGLSAFVGSRTAAAMMMVSGMKVMPYVAFERSSKGTWGSGSSSALGLQAGMGQKVGQRGSLHHMLVQMVVMMMGCLQRKNACAAPLWMVRWAFGCSSMGGRMVRPASPPCCDDACSCTTRMQGFAATSACSSAA